VLGLVANALNIVVLTRRNMISATNCILTGLHPDRTGRVRRADDGRLPAVRAALLRAVRHRGDADTQQSARSPLHALLRLFQRRRSHRLHLADGRPRRLQVAYSQRPPRPTIVSAVFHCVPTALGP